jgi:hypothetical protein
MGAGRFTGVNAVSPSVEMTPHGFQKSRTLVNKTVQIICNLGV